MRHTMLTILTLAVLMSTAHAPDPPSSTERFAQVTTDAINAKEEAPAAAGDRVSAAIRRFTKTDAESQDATFEEMRKHLSLLRPLAEEALKGYADFRTASESLRKELADSPTAYRLAADAFRQKAKTYETAELRRRILDLADNCERLIPLMGERVKRLDVATADTARMERFLSETNRFLGDFETFLKLYPGNQSLELRRNNRSQLETYKKAFEEMLKNMDAFTDKLKAESGSAKLQAERENARAMEVAARVEEAERARAMEVAARVEQAEAEAQRRNARAVAAYRSAYESQLSTLHWIYRSVLENPRSLEEAQIAAVTLREIELRLSVLRQGS
jgi:hypothetical protein